MSETSKYHDDFYDCESTVDAGEQDSRDKLLEDANALAIDYWDRSRTWGDANALKKDVIALLDRQAAITERECFERSVFDLEAHKRIIEQDRTIVEYASKNAELQAKVDELAAERDKLCWQVDEQPNGNGLRETALDYTERLGEASKTLHIEMQCTYDDLRVLCKTLMGVHE